VEQALTVPFKAGAVPTRTTSTEQRTPDPFVLLFPLKKQLDDLDSLVRARATRFRVELHSRDPAHHARSPPVEACVRLPEWLAVRDNQTILGGRTPWPLKSFNSNRVLR
jgi:hypothetical protein